MVVFEHSSFCFKQIVPPQTHAIGWASVAGKVVQTSVLYDRATMFKQGSQIAYTIT